MIVYMGKIANQRKVPKWLPFKNFKSASLNIKCAYTLGQIGIFVPNMKFLCQTLWLGGVCTDDDANDDDTNEDTRWTKHDSRLFG